MSSVLARFHMTEVSRHPYHPSGEAVRVKLAPTKGEPFGPATPQGTIEMLIVNMAAAKVFLDAPIGQYFDVQLTPVKPDIASSEPA